MKPISYEIKRTLTSKFVIILIIAIVGLSGLLAYENASSNSTGVPNSIEAAYGYYLNGNNLTMVTYVYNEYGNTVNNVNVYYQYNDTVYNSKSINGYANTTFPIKRGNQIPIDINYTHRQFGTTVVTPTIQYIVNYGIKYSGLEIYNGIFDPKNTSNMGFIAMYIGNNGSSSPPIKLIVPATNNSSINPTEFNYNYTYNFTSISIVKVYPTINVSNKNDSFYVKAENATGASIKIYSGLEGGRILTIVSLMKLSSYTPMTQTKLQDLVFSGISSILGLFIPILAIFTAYLTYGKDRTSGVLESVLKRPVTRGQLITTRFLSNAIAIFIAAGLAMVVTDLIYYNYFHLYFYASFLAELIWTYFVEGVAFLAVVYLISHLVKSQGALLGIAIGIFIVLDLFWEIIPMAVISALGISSSSTSYVTLNIIFDYISPAGYGNLFQTLITDKLGTFGAVTINPGLYGITLLFLVIAGMLWILVPFVLAYLLARYRD